MIDWTKPIETVPCDRNPVPAVCAYLGIDEDGDHMVVLESDWFDPDHFNRGRGLWHWYFDQKGCSGVHSLPNLRNVAESQA